ncbi:hypothetical protein [Mesorhizobium loti]|uniref:hypothetical protein n=1 Tax=Rhizobium loti TaxID=381 RepID=UPI0012DB46D7|nr:hypothetical protein [Mesorhizobium loti]
MSASNTPVLPIRMSEGFPSQEWAISRGAIDMGSVLELVGELRQAERAHGSFEDMFDDIMVFVARQGRRAV